MRRAIVIGTFALLGLSASGAIQTGPERELRGEYFWSGGRERGPVAATFRPKDADTWEVEFSFRFDGRAHRYVGTAAGSLESGELEGIVQNEDRRRSFRFTGTVRAGRFEGTHREVSRNGREEPTGTLTLTPR